MGTNPSNTLKRPTVGRLSRTFPERRLTWGETVHEEDANAQNPAGAVSPPYILTTTAPEGRG